MRFNFCPVCGEKLGTKELGDEGKVPFCQKCNRPWFDGFATCVIGLAADGDECVVLKQNSLSEKYYVLVSGYVKPFERAEDAMIREIEEEIGLAVLDMRFTGTYAMEGKSMLMLGFICKCKKGKLKTSCEVDYARWVNVKDAADMMHPGGSVSRRIVNEYLESL